jgi:DNA-binding transcriptional LysR family regulator
MDAICELAGKAAKSPGMAAKTQNGFRWDDARILLALHRGGTLSAAGMSLGIDASTVGRRIEALEQALGARLFDRTPDGAVPTAVADELLPHAEAMERAAVELAGGAGSFEREVEGVVRLSVPPGIADFFVAPFLPALLARHPRLRLELDSRIGYVDLARREADLVLRGMRPDRGDLVAVRVVGARAVPFGRDALVARLGRVSDIAAVPWITYGLDLAHIPDAAWVGAAVPESAIVLRTSSFTAQVAAVDAGVGVTLIAEALVATRPHLVQLAFTRSLATRLPPFPEGQLWLAAHRAMRFIPRVAAVWEFIIEHAQALAAPVARRR